MIELRSSVLKLSDAFGDSSIELSVDAVRQHVEIFTHAANEATEVHLVVSGTEGRLDIARSGSGCLAERVAGT